METLKSELIASHEETERTARELDSIRSRALNENTQETLQRERELRETMGELERCRMERDEWEQAAMQDRVAVEEARSTLETLRHDLEIEREVRERERTQLEAAKETASNLQSVLEDFQVGTLILSIQYPLRNPCVLSKRSRASACCERLQVASR